MANVPVKKEEPQLERTGLTRSISPLLSLSPREFITASPFELMRQFTEEIDRVFANFGVGRWHGAGSLESTSWSPPIEVFERGNELVVRAELPGLSKDDVKVEITNDGLVIEGERKSEHEDTRKGYYRSERSYGQFYRLISLPEGANVDQIKAQFNSGILEVSIPIPEGAKKRRQVPITSGEQSQPAQASGKS